MVEGRPIPNRMREAPQLELGLELYYQGFIEVNTERPAGFGVAPIPIKAMRSWARENGLDAEQEESFVYLASEMDRVLMKHLEKKSGNQQRPEPVQPSTTGHRKRRR